MNQLPCIARHVSFDLHGVTLIHDLSLTIQQQGITIVMGPNGAGKSLTLALLHGLLSPNAGDISWNGIPAPQARHHQSMVFQKASLLHRSVIANLTFPLALKGVPRRERYERAHQHLETVGLNHLALKPAHQLSLGQQHIIALLRATITEPQTLLLDEPTASLDHHSTRLIEQTLHTLKHQSTIIMTTHDDAQAKRLADDVLFIHNGRLREHTPARQFFAEPQSHAARQFLTGELLS